MNEIYYQFKIAYHAEEALQQSGSFFDERTFEFHTHFILVPYWEIMI